MGHKHGTHSSRGYGAWLVGVVALPCPKGLAAAQLATLAALRRGLSCPGTWQVAAVGSPPYRRPQLSCWGRDL